MGVVFNYWHNPQTGDSVSAYYYGSTATSTSATHELTVPVSASSQTMRLSYSTFVYGTAYPGNSYTVYVNYYRTNSTFISGTSYSWGPYDQRWDHTLTVPANTKYIRVYWSLTIYYVAERPNHTLSSNLTAFRLCTQNSTSYIDGDTSGYVWESAPNNSYTRRADVNGIASATSTSTGTLETSTQPFITLAATTGSTGTLETYLTGSEAHATTGSTGTLEVWPHGPMAADATGSSTGTLEIALLIGVDLAAAAVSTGTLEIAVAAVTFADAITGSTGTLEIGLPPDAAATSTSTSTGTLEVAIAGVTSAAATCSAIGTLDVGQAVPAGAFNDFAIFGILETDPLMSVTAASNGGTTTGAAAAEWVRIYAEFTGPGQVAVSDKTLWKRAAYAVPGIYFPSLAAGNWQEFTRIQAEIAGGSGPGPYADGASLRPLIYPDRLNLAPGTVHIDATPGTDYDAVTVTSPIAGDTAPGRRVDLLTTDTSWIITTVADRLKPHATYTVSLYVRITSGLAETGFTVLDQSTTLPISATAAYSAGKEAPDLGPGWRRISATFAAPTSGSATVNYFAQIIPPHTATQSIFIAGMLIEEGAVAKPYFFNPGTDPEIRYRKGFSDPSGGVFEFDDIERKTYVITEALKDQVPAGIGVTPLEFGMIPHYDS